MPSLQGRRPISEGHKVLFLHSSLQPTDNAGGAGESLRTIVTGLTEAFSPIVCASFRGNYPASLEAAGIRCEYRIDSDATARWMSRFARIRGGGLAVKYMHSRQLAAFLHQWRPDIVHINLLRKWDRFDARAARTAGALVVGHVRSLEHQVTFSEDDLLACDLVICVSDHVLRYVKGMAPSVRAVRLWNSVIPKTYRRRKEPSDAQAELGLPTVVSGKWLVSIAALEPRKGHDTAIRALTVIRARGIEADLAIVGSAYAGGDAPERRRLMELAEALKLSEHVFFLGQVEASRMHLVYAAADIVLALSKDGEAFGRVPVEAAVAGRPIIATAVGATPEIVLDDATGLLVAPEDPSAAAQLAEALLIDEAKRHSIVAAASGRAAECFHQHVQVQTLEALYHELLS